MGGTASVPMLSPDGGLTHYLTEIRKFPMLQPDQESAYAKRWREHGEREAAYHLVTSHLRLVAKIAMRYRGYGLPIADIISEGNVGLMQAVKRFEPERGFRLATYAMWWIKASIQEYILRSWSLVKMGSSAAQKKLFFKLRRTKAEISALEDGDLRPEHTATIAQRLGVQENDVVEMNRRLGGDVSLNTLVHADEAGEVQDWLVDPAPSPEAMYADQEEANHRRQALAEAMEVLNTRERCIFQARFLSEPAVRLEELATRYGISRERVRQIEIRAYEKVRAAVRACPTRDRPLEQRPDARPSSTPKSLPPIGGSRGTAMSLRR
ncbi:RNA polymerase sigma factor RpoH [Bradyrhizobium sp. AUGA SZCCT0160]|uniref:RNA polymerase sigma factor RpoH n=1 Tax=Bradyrhizobium sp. AUGA SZCCT0160 TaxID=2807662 RepID=UPI001BA5FD4A|nr:RNA polymerase sigma factor RpoH [Bradyrhizobium sp. AUGA SZCCT0160]MBR1187389.1 RNA polymerase sigma factor RpoH [Bradyrhizobium sp. AUGA SZCCT0160]